MWPALEPIICALSTFSPIDLEISLVVEAPPPPEPETEGPPPLPMQVQNLDIRVLLRQVENLLVYDCKNVECQDVTLSLGA